MIDQMQIENTSIRLKRILKERNLRQVDLLELAKPFLSKVEELTKQNQELKFKIENEKVAKIQQEANSSSIEFIYDLIKRFDTLESAKEKNDSLKMIFGTLEYDPYSDSFKY